jgi:hypothetical protein
VNHIIRTPPLLGLIWEGSSSCAVCSSIDQRSAGTAAVNASRAVVDRAARRSTGSDPRCIQLRPDVDTTACRVEDSGSQPTCTRISCWGKFRLPISRTNAAERPEIDVVHNRSGLTSP